MKVEMITKTIVLIAKLFILGTEKCEPRPIVIVTALITLKSFYKGPVNLKKPNNAFN